MKLRKLINLNVWPVVQRELREGSRRAFNHWLRVAAAAAGTFLLWVVVADADEPAATIGLWLFNCLHALLLWLICLAVPTMTADCIAREKRDGTLGLLFLTPLSAMGIVLGKGVVLAVRAFTLWLAVLPVLTIPFLMGGIGRTDVFRAIAIEFCATLLCLAAGLLASSLVKSRGAAFVLALLLAASFVILLAVVLFPAIAGPPRISTGNFNLFRAIWMIGLVPLPPDAAAFLIGGPTIPRAALYSIIAVSFEVALLLFSLAVWFSAWCINRSWQDKAPSRQQQYLLNKYCTPLFQSWFSRRMRRSLDRNPIAWLQQYSWKARLTKWGLCLVFLLIECFAVTGGSDEMESSLVVLLLILAAAATFVGVSSFLAEKRNGALELLLVTPISVNKIILGCVTGLWKQFLPAALLLVTCDLGDYWLDGELHFPSATSPWVFSSLNDYLVSRLTYACLFLALPFCATYFALRVKNLIVASVLTWITLLIPVFMAGSFNWFDEIGYTATYCSMLLAANFALVLLICFLLRHSLSRRIYSF